MAGTHSKYSPSGASRYTRCPGSVALSKDIPSQSSTFAREGTAAHALAENLLTNKIEDLDSMLGETIVWDETEDVIGTWIIDEDMIYYIKEYQENVKKRIAMFEKLEGVARVVLCVEQRVDISNILGVADQSGTADVVIRVEFESGETIISVEDLKYGKGVKVEAQDNEQLMLYAAGAKETCELSGYTIKDIYTVIHQPRLNHLSEAVYTREEMDLFCKTVNEKVAIAEKAYFDFDSGVIEAEELPLSPGDKQCLFCKAKAICPAVTKQVLEAAIDAFDNLDQKEIIESCDKTLSEKMAMIPIIEKWCKAIKTEVYDKLTLGEKVEGYKLVTGRLGNRKWQDDKQAIETLRAIGLDDTEIVIEKVISPTQAKKLVKTNEDFIAGIEAMTTRSEGKPTVVKDSDRRESLDAVCTMTALPDLTKKQLKEIE